MLRQKASDRKWLLLACEKKKEKNVHFTESETS